jgi:16S rRNA C1402 N4-methylase RsmH
VSSWGASKVNVNTAPRQVLEAALTFGGNARQIAQSIIEQRRIKPFKDIEELKRILFRYSDSIEKCKDFIETRSNFYTIRVIATSGTAKTSAIIAVRKFNNVFEKIGVFSE